MNVKVKKQTDDGAVRLEAKGEIKEVILSEEFLHPDNESIAICFKGKQSSGIIELSTEEFERVYATIKKRMHLIKGFKIIH